MAVDAPVPPHGYWQQHGLALLWFALLAGPAAWAGNELAGYALVKWTCASGYKVVLTGIAAAALMLTLSGAWVGWRCRARARPAMDDGGSVVD